MVDILEEDEAKGAIRVQGRQTSGRESIPVEGEIDAGVKLTQSNVQITIEGNTIYMMLYC